MGVTAGVETLVAVAILVGGTESTDGITRSCSYGFEALVLAGGRRGMLLDSMERSGWKLRVHLPRRADVRVGREVSVAVSRAAAV